MSTKSERNENNGGFMVNKETCEVSERELFNEAWADLDDCGEPVMEASPTLDTEQNEWAFQEGSYLRYENEEGRYVKVRDEEGHHRCLWEKTDGEVIWL